MRVQFHFLQTTLGLRGEGRIKRDANSELRQTQNREKSTTCNGNALEFGAVTIDFIPGPDAQERLRRLFTILINLMEEGQSTPGTDELRLN